MKVRFAVSPGGRSFDAEGLVGFAETSERLGFDTVWLSDVPLGPIGDPLVTLTYLAARTTRLKLGVNLVPLGRNPMLVARQLAQLDRFSGGRLLVTLVPGLDQPGERAALGLPKGDRGVRMEETIGLLRRWWDGERVHHHGDGWDFEGIAVEPTPLQVPLEIWLAGIGPRALERVARCGDGWLTAAQTPEEAGRGRRTIEAHCAALGREVDVEHFGVSIPYARERVPEATVQALRARRKGAGDLGDIVPVGAGGLCDLVGRYLEQGLSKFVLRPVDGTDPAADLAWLAEVVLPLQT